MWRGESIDGRHLLSCLSCMRAWVTCGVVVVNGESSGMIVFGGGSWCYLYVCTGAIVSWTCDHKYTYKYGLRMMTWY